MIHFLEKPQRQDSGRLESMDEIEDGWIGEHAAVQDAKNGTGGEAPVLVAIDMSEASRVALVWACTFAAMAGLPVIALHVLHDPAEAPGKYRGDGRGPLRPVSDVANEILVEFLTKTKAEHPELKALAQIDGQVASGLPAHTIVNQARRLNASLVVLGSRGQSGLQRLMNGSIAQKVMQLSPTPVTIVKAPGS